MSDGVKIVVQWGNQKVEVMVDPQKTVSALMESLASKTGVPINRQKLMMRRRQLFPEMSWEEGLLKDGARAMLIGTAEPASVITPAPVEESLPEPQQEEGLRPDDTIGLKNLGNTCYLNSVLQVFRSIPELVAQLKSSKNPLIDSLFTFYRDFPKHLESVVKSLRVVNKKYAEIDPETSLPKQMDASEAWTDIIQVLAQEYGDAVTDLFRIDFEVKNSDTDAAVYETDDRLRCVIQQDTSHIEMGIEMDAEIMKDDLKINRSRRIVRYPPYLVVQLMRFTYKVEELITAKVVKRVAHPEYFNILPYLSDAKRTEIINDHETNGTKIPSYRLKAVITHRGRSADSGHYVAHIRKGEYWVKFDDEKVTEVEWEDIERLSGTGDWFCSLILVYSLE